MANNTMDAKWHDLAQRFDAGEAEIVAPPLSFEDARTMRFAFYKWRRELKAAERVSSAPMYREVHRVMVTTRFLDDVGKWEVRFQLPEATATFQALDQMMRGAPSQDT